MRQPVEDREVELVGVEMQDVERGCHPPHLVEHHHVVGDRVDDARAQPERLGAAGHEPGPGARMAAGEQRHVVALRHQLLREVGDDPLRPAVKARGHALDQRGNLGDSHRT